MDKLALATLMSWGEEISGRKRLQKVVFLLQRAGFPADAAFILHHYGPYSRDVSQTSDELVALGILNETAEPCRAGKVYKYKMTKKGRELLSRTVSPRLQEIEKFHELVNRWQETSTWHLELGSTISYFKQQSSDWDDAVNHAREFKKVSDSHSEDLKYALEIAQQAESFANA